MTYSNQLGAASLSPTNGQAGKPDPGIVTRNMKRKGMHDLPISLYDSALSQSAYGRPRGMTPRLQTSASPIRTITPANGASSLATITMYDTALSEDAFGKPARLGDFFGDVMGAVIGQKNWDARPDWMKKIRVKPDPAKILQAASRIVPPRHVNRVLDQAQGAGVNLFYQTPIGNVPITSQTAGSLYSGMPILAQAKGALDAVPIWVWIAGGGLIIVLLVAIKK